ncbi:EamA family transporter [Paenibacillus sp. P96]|uniref:EamA family transporter n=1 Tax=Paenibacillus zeirhizosphaerae TaxID=2987519 RepID=A0ABT9FKP8_9BACL|nr:EamA family transporter [Paenibacillus sp. P96]MDP4095301.1 EamA family transporter [Paenibacillus sp. P96]
MIGVAFVVMCLIFGTTFLAIKVGIDAGLPPFLSGGVRFTTAGVIVLLLLRMTGKVKISLLLRKETMISGAGLTFGTFAALYWAEQHVSSGIGAVLSATGPLMIVLIQSLLLRQKVSRRSIIGCLAGFTGVVLVMIPGIVVDVSGLWVLGCVLVLAGEVCYTGGALYSKHVITKLAGTNPIALNAAQMLHGGLLLLVLSLFTESWQISNWSPIPAAASLLYLTVIGSMAGHSLFYWIMARTNPLFPSTWLYISPPIAVGLGVLLYGEEVSLISLAGVVLILGGMIFMNQSAWDWLRRKGKLFSGNKILGQKNKVID